MLILKYIAKLIKILRSGASPNQIAGGLVLGMMLGLIPFWTLHSLMIVLLLILLNVNLGMGLLAFALFSGIAYLLDPAFHALGYFLLVKVGFLKPLWVSLYNAPVMALTRFYNTVVMGSTAVSLLAAAPSFWFFKRAVIIYRERVDQRIQKWKVFQLIKGSKLFSLYEKIKQFGE